MKGAWRVAGYLLLLIGLIWMAVVSGGVLSRSEGFADLFGLAGAFAFHAVCMALGAFCVGKAAQTQAGQEVRARPSPSWSPLGLTIAICVAGPPWNAVTRDPLGTPGRASSLRSADGRAGIELARSGRDRAAHGQTAVRVCRVQRATLPRNYKWIALGITSIGVSMTAIDATVVILALPSMMVELRANLALALAVAAGSLSRDEVLSLFLGTNTQLGGPAMVAFVRGMQAAFRASMVICLLAAAMSLVRGPESRRPQPTPRREREPAAPGRRR